MPSKEEFIEQMKKETKYMTDNPWNDDHQKQKEQLSDEWSDQIKKMMDYTKQKQPDPVQILREEIQAELSDIKKAIHTIGIMLDSDAPTKEMLEKHKTLRDAYRKYKMIEALILGQQK